MLFPKYTLSLSTSKILHKIIITKKVTLRLSNFASFIFRSFVFGTFWGIYFPWIIVYNMAKFFIRLLVFPDYGRPNTSIFRLSFPKYLSWLLPISPCSKKIYKIPNIKFNLKIKMKYWCYQQHLDFFWGVSFTTTVPPPAALSIIFV